MMDSKVLKVISVILVCVTMAIITIVPCIKKTPEERFEKIRSQITPVESGLREMVKAKAKQTLKNNNYEVEDLIIKANYIDGANNIYIYVLAKYNGSEKNVYTFKLKSSEVQGPLCTILRKGSSDGTIYEKEGEYSTERHYITFGEKYPIQYVSECSYHLEGDTIVMEE